MAESEQAEIARLRAELAEVRHTTSHICPQSHRASSVTTAFHSHPTALQARATAEKQRAEIEVSAARAQARRPLTCALVRLGGQKGATRADRVDKEFSYGARGIIRRVCCVAREV